MLYLGGEGKAQHHTRTHTHTHTRHQVRHAHSSRSELFDVLPNGTPRTSLIPGTDPSFLHKSMGSKIKKG